MTDQQPQPHVGAEPRWNYGCPHDHPSQCDESCVIPPTQPQVRKPMEIAAVAMDGAIRAGDYVATATVSSTRRNLFYWPSTPGRERHLGTFTSGSRSKVTEFEQDCARIVTALAAYDAALAEQEAGDV